MKCWKAQINDQPSKRFVIEEDEGIGFYLYVYEGEKCTHDYLQDTFQFAVEIAEEDFGVDPNVWEQDP